MALVGILIALSRRWPGRKLPVRGAILTALVVLAAVTWAAGWGAGGKARPAIRASWSLARKPPRLPCAKLARDLMTLSANQTTDPRTLALVVESPRMACWAVPARYVECAVCGRAGHIVGARGARHHGPETGPPFRAVTPARNLRCGTSGALEGKTTGDVLSGSCNRKTEPPPAYTAGNPVGPTKWISKGNTMTNESKPSFLDTPSSRRSSWTWKRGCNILFTLAASLRALALGDRVLSHDESLHAYFSWGLYAGRGFPAHAADATGRFCSTSTR